MIGTRSKKLSPLPYILLIIFIAITSILVTFILTPFPWENRVLVQVSKGTTLSQEEMVQLTTGSMFTQIYPYARETVSLAITGSRTAKSVLYQVTADYFKASPLTMMDGRVLWAEDVGQQFAVVSDITAGKLFARTHVIGETIVIDKAPYTIIGVFKSHRDFLTDLAYYGEDIVYVIQDPSAPLKVTHIEAVLRNPKEGSLGLQWLERFKTLSDNLVASGNLSQSWFDLKLIARGFVSLYGFILWWMIFKKSLPLYTRNKNCIKDIWQKQYAIIAMRMSLRPFIITMGLWLLIILWFGGLATFFLTGIVVPPEYIPRKFLFKQIRDAFFVYVNTANTRIAMAHPLVSLVHWWQVLLTIVGTAGSLMVIYLRKKWEVHPCKEKPLSNSLIKAEQEV